jgi:hypothetical protein
MLLVQFTTESGSRRVASLDGDTLRVLDGVFTTYELAQRAIGRGKGLAEVAHAAIGTTIASYEAVATAGRILPPLDHADPAHCYVTGTGLTHLGSADARDAMHRKIGGDMETLSDSMKMFRLGVEGGKPAEGQRGVQPEWFYKGDGSILAASGQALAMPEFSLDGGEEPEIAGLYVIGENGQPYRLGFAIGNEFSDHVTERQNYLYLAHSKLRNCGLGPALRVGDLPQHIDGTSRIVGKDGAVRWQKAFVSGEQNMSHTIANLEYHHFKYGLFCRPGDVHIHFFGTATLSFADGISVQPGETFEVEAPAFGPALRNPLRIQESRYQKVSQL